LTASAAIKVLFFSIDKAAAVRGGSLTKNMHTIIDKIEIQSRQNEKFAHFLLLIFLGSKKGGMFSAAIIMK